MGDDPERGLDVLHDGGILRAIFPGGPSDDRLRRRCEWSHKDVWKHTKQVVRQAVPRLEVRWASLFHDIGKVKTRSISPDGKVHFLGHAEVGTRMFDKLERRIGIFATSPRSTTRCASSSSTTSAPTSTSRADRQRRAPPRASSASTSTISCLARADITT